MNRWQSHYLPYGEIFKFCILSSPLQLPCVLKLTVYYLDVASGDSLREHICHEAIGTRSQHVCEAGRDVTGSWRP